MNTRCRAAAFVLILVLGAVSAIAEPPVSFGTAQGDLAIYASASVKARVVARLSEGDSFRVLETAGKDQVVDGKSGRWMRVSTAEGAEGWLHGGCATVKSGFLSLEDFPDAGAYGRYVRWAFRKGERVRAVSDYEKVSAGDTGWYHSISDGDPPILVVWDRDLDATPWVEALPADCPRILSGRVYFVFPETIEAAGSGEYADFDTLALEWKAAGAPESLFPVGSRVILGEHRTADEDDPDSANWAEEMAEYVGEEAVVEEHRGDDSWGCPVVTVDVDGGSYYWRTENLELVERGSGESEVSPDSEDEYEDEHEDEHEDEEASYEDYDKEDLALEGAFPVGSRVILGRHTQLDPQNEDSTYWAPEMDDYVGCEAVITEHAGLCPWGEPTATVDVDQGGFYWRLCDMELLEEGPGVYEEGGEEYEEGEDYGSDSVGMVEVGSAVILGRHDSVNGDDNWVEEMDEFVGRETVVTEILGTDSQGFTVVSVQGNDWSWRIRNLAVRGRGEPGSYGFQVGDTVVLGRHRSVDGKDNWYGAMDEFVGRAATITKLIGAEVDGSGCFLVRVDLDKGNWLWRAESLRPQAGAASE